MSELKKMIEDDEKNFGKENVPFMPLRTFTNIININPKGKIIKKK